MAPRRRIGWQNESLAVAGGLAVLALAFCVGVALLAPLLDRLSFFGMPAGFFLLSIGTPVILTAAAFWFLFLQARIDRTYHRIED